MGLSLRSSFEIIGSDIVLEVAMNDNAFRSFLDAFLVDWKNSSIEVRP
jgi:hypothetical protein